jgi:peptidyl-tRNA hydrolase ICT1
MGRYFSDSTLKRRYCYVSVALSFPRNKKVTCLRMPPNTNHPHNILPTLTAGIIIMTFLLPTIAHRGLGVGWMALPSASRVAEVALVSSSSSYSSSSSVVAGTGRTRRSRPHERIVDDINGNYYGGGTRRTNGTMGPFRMTIIGNDDTDDGPPGGISSVIRRGPSSSSSPPHSHGFSSASSSSPSYRESTTSNTSNAWIVPDRIPIPEDQLITTYSRSSGAGGQNVNKVNTRVEMRLHIASSSSWMPHEVMQRLLINESNRINSEGYLIVTSQEYRTQLQNRKDAMNKLENILKESWIRPKIRKLREGLSKRSKENRREMKRRNGLKKESRKNVDF